MQKPPRRFLQWDLGLSGILYPGSVDMDFSYHHGLAWNNVSRDLLNWIWIWSQKITSARSSSCAVWLFGFKLCTVVNSAV